MVELAGRTTGLSEFVRSKRGFRRRASEVADFAMAADAAAST